jgi:nitrogenase molybdenum-iron protein NifN
MTTTNKAAAFPAAADFTATRNPCKMCAPFGACLAFKGIRRCVPFLHGSQGCATYIRRYLIGHFREPIDVACSNFSEATAIFGGKENLLVGFKNVARQYQPDLIGVATTCLAETIGDDVAGYVNEILAGWEGQPPRVVRVSTPSYRGTHADGFHAAVLALVDTLARGGTPTGGINLLPGMVSPEDLRLLKQIGADFGLAVTILPDYSDTLDGPAWQEYQLIPDGGTTLAEIEAAGRAAATVEFASVGDAATTPGTLLDTRFGVRRYRLGMPIGVRRTDEFLHVLETLSGRPVPALYAAQRGRLIDSYVDGHKHVFERKAVVYGDEDLVVGLASFLAEIGIVPVLCASGGTSGRLREEVLAAASDYADQITVLEGADFAEIEEAAAGMHADLLIGHSKGYRLARRMGIPLVRVGFPIHDRLGGARILHLGYAGAQVLFDRIANTLLETVQDDSPVGYGFM